MGHKRPQNCHTQIERSEVWRDRWSCHTANNTHQSNSRCTTNYFLEQPFGNDLRHSSFGIRLQSLSSVYCIVPGQGCCGFYRFPPWHILRWVWGWHLLYPPQSLLLFLPQNIPQSLWWIQPGPPVPPPQCPASAWSLQHYRGRNCASHSDRKGSYCSFIASSGQNKDSLDSTVCI